MGPIMGVGVVPVLLCNYFSHRLLPPLMSEYWLPIFCEKI